MQNLSSTEDIQITEMKNKYNKTLHTFIENYFAQQNNLVSVLVSIWL